MIYFNILIVLVMIIGAIAAAFTKNIMASIIIFMVYSLMMAILWQQLNAPDLAITEASVGAGITSILFVVAYRKVRRAK